jgi:hypothetical protein
VTQVQQNLGHTVKSLGLKLNFDRKFSKGNFTINNTPKYFRTNKGIITKILSDKISLIIKQQVP